MSPIAAAPAPMSLPAPRTAAPMLMVSVTMPRDWPRVMLEAVLRSMARLMRRPELRVAGWNREIDFDGPVVARVVSYFTPMEDLNGLMYHW